MNPSPLRHVAPAALLLALLLYAPGWRLGFFVDDYYWLGVFEGTPRCAHTSWDPFRFTPGDADLARSHIARGDFPWWTLPELRMAFFRPLFVLTLKLDHWIFGRDSLPYSLHNTAWFLLGLCLLILLFRRWLPGPAGVLALFLFVLSPANAQLPIWASVRSSLLAFVFAAATLYGHWRWREEGWRPGFRLSLLAFGAALLSYEAGLAVLAFLFAYEISAGRGPLASRLAALLPFAVIAGTYLVLYRVAGYGFYASSAYVDPLMEPTRYFALAAARIPSVLISLCFPVPVDAWSYVPWVYRPAWPASLPVLLAAGLPILAGAILCRGLSESDRRMVRWIGLGTFLSLFMAAVAVPASRSLPIPVLGASAVWGLILQRAWAHRRTLSWSGRLAAVPLAFGQVLIAPVFLETHIAFLVRISEGVRRAAETAELDDRALPRQTVFVLRASDIATGMYLEATRSFHRKVRPRQWHLLSYAQCSHLITRPTLDAIEIRAVDGQFLASGPERYWRDYPFPLRRGEQVRLDGAVVEVLQEQDGFPVRIGVRFDSPPESSDTVFLAWRKGKFRRIPLPPPGERLLIPWEPSLLTP